jgi:hypothetical protein
MIPDALVASVIEWGRPGTAAQRLGMDGMRAPVSLSMIDAAIRSLMDMNLEVNSGELDVVVNELQMLRLGWQQQSAAELRLDSTALDTAEYDLEALFGVGDEMEIET